MTDQQIVEILAKHGIGEAWHVGVTPFPLDGEDAPLFIAAYREMLEAARSTIAAPAQPTCRDDGRCQYAIDRGAEGMGACPVGQCCQSRRDASAAPAQEPVAAPCELCTDVPHFQCNEHKAEPVCEVGFVRTVHRWFRDVPGGTMLYAAPPSTAAPVVPDVDWLSNVIRMVDGEHKLGAGALAEKIVEAIAVAPKPDA